MIISRPDLKFLFAHPAHLIAFGFGSGLAPKAPATVGTLVGLPLFWLVMTAAPDLPNRMILLIAAFLLGVWACARTGRALGVADHGGMVVMRPQRAAASFSRMLRADHLVEDPTT